MSSKLLINESPIYVLPTLANIIGLNEAIILQQLHFWLQNKTMGKTVDGTKWFRNTLADWQENNFEFWSESTIYRTFNKLEEKQIVISRTDLNLIGYDRTKWYTINYDVLNSFIEETPISQNDKMQSVNMQNGSRQSETTIPNISTNVSTKNTSVSNETEGGNVFQQSEPQINSDIERQVYEQMAAIGTIDLMSMLGENEQTEISNINLIADKDHPAIILWRSITERYPKKQLYQLVADTLGNDPNETVLRHVRTKWLAKGYNPVNIDDQLDWYTQALEWYRKGYQLSEWQPVWKGQKNNKNKTDELRGLTIG